MDKKKKIYIAVIVVCFAASLGILFYSGIFGGSSTPTPAPSATINTNNTSSELDTNTGSNSSVEVGNIPSLQTHVEHPVPRVFPAGPELDVAVFETTEFKLLNDYAPLTLTPQEIGRDNPYLDY